MARTTRSRFAPAVVALLLLAGCGASGGDDEAGPTTDDGSTTEVETPTTEEAPTTEVETPTTEASPDPGADDDVCEPLLTVSEYDERTGDLVRGGTPWPELQAFFVESIEEVVAAYDEAISLADYELAEHLTVLRDFTDGFTELAASSDSLEELSTGATEMAGVLEAGEAGLALDTFAEDTCGFSTGGS